MKGLLDRLIYLSLGLSFILIFIGVKLMLLFAHEQISEAIPKIDTLWSLGVIVAILLVATIASLIKSAKDPEAVATAGRITTPWEDSKDRD